MPPLLIDLRQGSFFAILPQERTKNTVPEWYSGNIYALPRAVPPAVRFPTAPSLTEPTTYDLFVSGDYEVNQTNSDILACFLLCMQIRLFGDPGPDTPPTLDVTLNAAFAPISSGVVHEPTHNVIPNFVDGFALGNALGVGVRSYGNDSWTLSRAQVSDTLPVS